MHRLPCCSGSSSECDDGNAYNDDGCSETCEIETGWTCALNPNGGADICTTIVEVKKEEDYTLIIGLSIALFLI